MEMYDVLIHALQVAKSQAESAFVREPAAEKSIA